MKRLSLLFSLLPIDLTLVLDGLAQTFRAAGVFMRAEYEKWGRVVRETGATVN